jgi:hypothetical protein
MAHIKNGKKIKDFIGVYQDKMRFEQKKDGSCILKFDDEEVKILKKKKQLYFTSEALRHFGNALMKMVIEFNINFDNKTKYLCTDQSTKVLLDKEEDDKDRK